MTPTRYTTQGRVGQDDVHLHHLEDIRPRASVRKRVAVVCYGLAILLVAAVAVTLVLVAQHNNAPRTVAPRVWKGTPQPLGIPGNWRYVHDDEFDGTRLDKSIWRTGWYGAGITGPTSWREDDCYSPANVSFPGDGSMDLAVTRKRSTCHGRTLPYTGALISTNPHDGRSSGGFEYAYGVVEARIYIPGIGGSIANWPAFWADGHHWPLDGEDDVMEGIDGDACFHFHSVGYTPRGPGGCEAIGPGWHTFASDWMPGKVRYYYDGRLVGTIRRGVTGKPMYIIISNTVWRSERALSRPDVLKVDYVRVWQPAAGANGKSSLYRVLRGRAGA